MDARRRAALLGLVVGFSHTVLRLFVLDSTSTALGASLTELLLQTLVATLLGLGVLLGLPLYGALRMGVPGTTSRGTALAVVVGVGTGVAVFATYPLLSAQAAGASFGEALQVRFSGAYLVNAVSPAAYSGVSALAGFLLAEQNT